MTTTPSDAAVAQAFRELLQPKDWTDNTWPLYSVANRAREIDALRKREESTTQAQPALDAGGGEFVLVPRVPTDHMLLLLGNQWDSVGNRTMEQNYTAMLAAAPQPTTPPAVEGDLFRVGDMDGGYSYFHTRAEALSHGHDPVAYVLATPPGEAVIGDELPELPEPAVITTETTDGFGGDIVPYQQNWYDDDQMRAYAIEALAKRGEGGEGCSGRTGST